MMYLSARRHRLGRLLVDDERVGHDREQLVEDEERQQVAGVGDTDRPRQTAS